MTPSVPLPRALRPAPPRPGADTTPPTSREAAVTVVDWLDERLSPGGGLRWFLWRKVPRGGDGFSYTLGVAALFAFLNQAVTGVFLAMYYDPAPSRAYESVRYITNEAFLGEFVRGMHKWGATVMVVCVFAHMGVNFFYGAYKYPRELNWVIGVALLICTLFMAFTGYLLPFDQRAYWATTVGVNISGTGPIIGPYLADFLRAGPDFTATTLSRFYAIHMLLVSGAIVTFILGHLYLVVRLGTTAHPWAKADVAAKSERV
jgi:menaquinol-cytochrome c reductase cytochrome b subunit